MTGTHAAAISTGYSSDISSVNPISDQYSTMTTGSIAVPSGKTKVTLDYYFVSDEFKEYLGSKYDDNATFTVSGSGGSRNIVLNSVNNWNTTALSGDSCSSYCIVFIVVAWPSDNKVDRYHRIGKQYLDKFNGV